MFQFQYRNKNQNFRISNFVVQFIKKKKKKSKWHLGYMDYVG